jgi:hypothetical protein
LAVTRLLDEAPREQPKGFDIPDARSLPCVNEWPERTITMEHQRGMTLVTADASKLSSFRANNLKLALLLTYITLGWMTIEGATSLLLGWASKSLLLEAFGIDSVIELFSGFVCFGSYALRRVVWQARSAPKKLNIARRGTLDIHFMY